MCCKRCRGTKFSVTLTLYCINLFFYKMEPLGSLFTELYGIWKIWKLIRCYSNSFRQKFLYLNWRLSFIYINRYYFQYSSYLLTKQESLRDESLVPLLNPAPSSTEYYRKHHYIGTTFWGKWKVNKIEKACRRETWRFGSIKARDKKVQKLI